MAAAALQALRRTVTVDWRAAAAAQAKALLLRTAREGHARIMREQAARAGVIPEWDAYANSPGNTSLETVRLPGPIVYRYRYRREILLIARELLRSNSPVESGEYRNGHFFLVNGLLTDKLPAQIAETDEVGVTNIVPYARRLEVGKTKSGRAFVLRVEPRIYERVAKRMLVPRYGRVADIEFGYVTLPNAYVVTGGLQRRTPHYAIGVRVQTQKHGDVVYEAGTAKIRKRRHMVGSQVQAPAIFVGQLR